MTAPTDSARLLSDHARRIWGDDWAPPLARYAGVNSRTAERIKEAVARGDPYPASRGVLCALSEALAASLAALDAGVPPAQK
jgi:hypothetical protein